MGAEGGWAAQTSMTLRCRWDEESASEKLQIPIVLKQSQTYKKTDIYIYSIYLQYIRFVFEAKARSRVPERLYPLILNSSFLRNLVLQLLNKIPRWCRITIWKLQIKCQNKRKWEVSRAQPSHHKLRRQKSTMMMVEQHSKITFTAWASLLVLQCPWFRRNSRVGIWRLYCCRVAEVFSGTQKQGWRNIL